MRSRTSGRAALFAASLALAPACVNAPLRDSCTWSARAERVASSCIAEPEVDRYLDEVARQVASQSQSLEPIRYAAHAELRYALREDGEVEYRCIRKSSDRALASRVLTAFDRAAPFPAIPRYARCIAGLELSRFISIRPGPDAPTIPYVHRDPDEASQPEESECFERPAVRAALESLHGDVAEAWQIPPGVAPDQRIVLRFRLLESGDVSEVEILSATDERTRGSALAAFRASVPFAALTEETSCLAGFRMNAVFANPETAPAR